MDIILQKLQYFTDLVLDNTKQDFIDRKFDHENISVELTKDINNNPTILIKLNSVDFYQKIYINDEFHIFFYLAYDTSKFVINFLSILDIVVNKKNNEFYYNNMRLARYTWIPAYVKSSKIRLQTINLC